MPRFRVNEYGEAKAEGRSFIIEAIDEEEALKKAPCQEWGAIVIRLCDGKDCDKEPVKGFNVCNEHGYGILPQ